VPYVRSDTGQRRERWAQLAPKGEGVRHIAMAWAGSPTHTRDRWRSLQHEELAPLLAIQSPKVRWHSLQVGPQADGLFASPLGAVISDHRAHLRDFADTAAAIDAMDLVISVDTAVAHLAGAMGKPVWMFVAYAPDFRWMLDREDSPWYPTMRLFREKRWGERAEVLGRMAEAVQRQLS
jgi:hypothetical protein